MMVVMMVVHSAGRWAMVHGAWGEVRCMAMMVVHGDDGGAWR